MKERIRGKNWDRVKYLLNSELLFVIYLFLFSVLKPIAVAFPAVSTVLLLVATVIIVGLSVYVGSLHFRVDHFERFVWLMAYLVTLFGLEYIFRNNEVLPQYAYHFCIYGVVPLFIMQYIQDYTRLLKYWCHFAIAIGLMFLADPLLKYQWSGGYMPFGFNQMLPAFCGAALMFFYYRKTWAVPLMMVFLVELLIYANKGATLTAAAFAVVLFVIFGIQTTKNTGAKAIVRRVAWISGIAIVLFVCFDPLLGFLTGALDYLGISSYALNSIRYGGIERIIGVRTDIWTDVLTEFMKNPLFGTGIGTYQAHAKMYPHNVFLEVLNASGFVAAGFFAAMLLRSIWGFVTAYKKKDNESLCMVALLYFMLSFLPMMISLTMWSYMPFWVYWGIWLYREAPSVKRIKEKR